MPLDKSDADQLGQFVGRKLAEADARHRHTLDGLTKRVEASTEDLAKGVAVVQDQLESAIYPALEAITTRLADVRDGEKGEPGQDGAPGIDGLDRPLVEPVIVKAGKEYPKGTVGLHGGGIWIAVKDAIDSPESDALAWQCLVEGWSDVSCEIQPDNSYKLLLRGCDGTELEADFDIPYMDHQGIYDAERAYSSGHIVTKGAAMFLATDSVDYAPPGKAWRQILVAPRGKMGPRGHTGEPGPTGPASTIPGPRGPEGPQGKPGRNGQDASLDPEFIAELRQLASETKAFEDGREASYAITSHRGAFKSGEQYRAGDVLNHTGGLWLVRQAGSWKRFADNKGAIQKLYSPPKVLHVPNMIWRGNWAPGFYAYQEVVRDAGYQCVVTNPKGTGERAAPQEQGAREWFTDSLGAPPTFPDSGSLVASELITLNRYIVASTGAFLWRARVYLPVNDVDMRYGAALHIDGAERWRSAEFSAQDSIDAGYSVPGWGELDLGQIILTPSQIVEIRIIAYTLANSTDITDSWTVRQHNTQQPAAGEIVQRGAELQTILVNQVADGGDQSAFMDTLVAGDDFAISGINYRINTISKSGAVYTLDISPPSNLPIGSQSVTWTHYAQQPIEYAAESGYWTANPAPNGAEGAYIIDGGEEQVSDTLFGADLQFSAAYVSPDWDVMAYTPLLAGGVQ